MSQAPATSTGRYQGRSVGGVARLWLDGVGAFLICFDQSVRIGGSGSDRDSKAEIALMSNLSRHHVRLIRSGEVWLIEALGPTFVDDRPVVKPRLLNDGNRLRLGATVGLKFRIPSTLTGTAKLEFDSPHRPNPTVDGIILLAETCVLGPGIDAHITTRSGSDRVLLTRRANGLWCQASEGVSVDGILSGTEAPCEAGRVYSGQNWRFRLEQVSSS
jgi:hypothetical protein